MTKMTMVACVQNILRRQLSATRILGFVTCCVLAFFYLSIVILILISFSTGRATQWPPPGWTIDWYILLFQNPRALESIYVSLIFAVTTGILTTILGTLTAYALTNFRLKWGSAIQLFSYFPMVISGLIIGIALLLYFHLIGLSLGYLSVIVAHTVRAFPFAVLIMITSFLGIKKSLIEASLDLGANKLSTFRRIILPLIAPGVVASLLISFTVSFDEIIATYFVIGGGLVTVPIYIINQIEFGISPELNALSTLVLFVSSLIVIISIWLRGRFRHS